MGKTTKHSQRSFISVALMFTFILMFVTAVVIQIFEAIETEFYIHLFTVIHIFSGLAFTILSICHMKKNWKTMKEYMVFGKRQISYALYLVLLIIIMGFLFVNYIMD